MTTRYKHNRSVQTRIQRRKSAFEEVNRPRLPIACTVFLWCLRTQSRASGGWKLLICCGNTAIATRGEQQADYRFAMNNSIT